MNKFGIIFLLVIYAAGFVSCEENDEEACSTCITYAEEIAYLIDEESSEIRSKLVENVCKGLEKEQTALCQFQVVPILEAMFSGVVDSFANPNLTCVEQGACSPDILSADIMFDSSVLDSFNTTCENCTSEIEGNLDNLKEELEDTLVAICQVNPGYSSNGLCESRAKSLRKAIKKAIKKKQDSMIICGMIGYCAYDFTNYN